MYGMRQVKASNRGLAAQARPCLNRQVLSGGGTRVGQPHNRYSSFTGKRTQRWLPLSNFSSIYSGLTPAEPLYNSVHFHSDAIAVLQTWHIKP